MAAYASSPRESSTRVRPEQPARPRLAPVTTLGEHPEPPLGQACAQDGLSAVLINQFIDRFAERIALVLADRLGADERDSDDWLDCRRAAEYWASIATRFGS